jgi:hypothetical protein
MIFLEEMSFLSGSISCLSEQSDTSLTLPPDFIGINSGERTPAHQRLVLPLGSDFKWGSKEQEKFPVETIHLATEATSSDSI